MRVDPNEYLRLPLRVHEFLSDVPLHDVWRADLRGGGSGRTARDAVSLLVDLGGTGLHPAARALFGIRKILGRAFGWDRNVRNASAISYVGRVSAEDRGRSLDPPGSRQGFWTVVYTFDGEALGEVINRTVHAFLHFALQPAGEGYTLYVAIYVKPANRFTPIYLAMIDPFRRRVIYPTLIRRVEDVWRRRWEGAA